MFVLVEPVPEELSSADPSRVRGAESAGTGVILDIMGGFTESLYFNDLILTMLF